MILTRLELESLVRLRHQRSPHELLGMHPLGDASGIVVRVLLPVRPGSKSSPFTKRTSRRFASSAFMPVDSSRESPARARRFMPTTWSSPMPPARSAHPRSLFLSAHAG